MMLLTPKLCSYFQKIIKTSIRPNNINFSQLRTCTQTNNEDKWIVWIDLEMTGLDIEKDHVLEIACVVTDVDLNIRATKPNISIKHSEEILKNMDPWCVAQHAKSGLTEASRNSNISLQEAEKHIIEFLRCNSVREKTSPLAGNSIHIDRRFLAKHMPKLDLYLHYRLIDVSSVKELAKRWFPDVYKNLPQKQYSHRCLNDILDSIIEMKHYKQHFFINKS